MENASYVNASKKQASLSLPIERIEGSSLGIARPHYQGLELSSLPDPMPSPMSRPLVTPSNAASTQWRTETCPLAPRKSSNALKQSDQTPSSVSGLKTPANLWPSPSTTPIGTSAFGFTFDESSASWESPTKNFTAIPESQPLPRSASDDVVSQRVSPSSIRARSAGSAIETDDLEAITPSPDKRRSGASPLTGEKPELVSTSCASSDEKPSLP
mmetsp:Transcript_39517/g.62754  ORF Transcript_39517/g.62754 Transcript_39517/m.62754 type:complete len:214 (-) Transcript_39517:105-746(-)